MNPDWESVGCEFKYRIFFVFFAEMPSLITLTYIQNRKDTIVFPPENF